MSRGRSLPYRRGRAALSRVALALVLTGVGWLALVPGAQALGPATTITLQLSPTTITADGVSTTQATATVTDLTSTGVPGETVTFSSSDLGETISTTTDNGNGTYTATITSSTTAGQVTITAADTSTAGITPAQQTLTQTPGQAANISLALQPSSIVADGTATSKATATLTDAHGNPVPGQAVTFSSTDPGEAISGTADQGNGTYTATITSSTTPGTPTITASAAGLHAQRVLTQTAGSPARISLTLVPSTITADGVSTSTATATVTDGSGNPVAGEAISFTSTDHNQNISGTADHGDGTYTATITSSTTVGKPKVTAHDVAAGLTSAAQTLTQTPGPPTSILLTLQPSTITADGVSKSTAKATVTDSLGHGVPGQSVSFSSTDPGEGVSPTSDNGNGVYTATITSSTTAGQASITATVAGITSAPQTLVQIPGRAANIALTLQPPVVAADGASLSTATATITDAHGNAVAGDTLRFSSSNPGDRIFPQSPTGNVYTASIISSTHPGNWTITATDSTAGISKQQTLKEVVGTSSTNLVISPASPASTNQNVALLATVSGSGGSPSGTVEFMAGGFPIPGCTSVPISPSSTLAVCQVPFAASQSPVQIAVAFTPDLASTVAGSSTTGAVTIGPASTSTTLGDSSPTASIGANETYTAFVSPGYRGPTSPTGTVTFKDAGKPIRGCASVPMQASAGAVTASCSASYSAVGTRRITATYSGDQNFNASSSGTILVPVQALGVITSPMQWTWGAITPSYTTIASMSANSISLGMKVIITCHGHGCPFAKRVATLSGGIRCTPTGKHHCGHHSRGPINLTAAFHRHHLKAGTRITVEIRRPGWVAKVYSFVIRSGRQPLVRISCLAPGFSKPGIGC